MPFSVNQIQQSMPYNLDVQVNGGSVAVTVITIRRDRISEVEALVNPPRADRTVNNGVARITFLVHGQRGTQGIVNVRQNGVLLTEEPFGGGAPLDLQIAYDIL